MWPNITQESFGACEFSSFGFNNLNNSDGSRVSATVTNTLGQQQTLQCIRTNNNHHQNVDYEDDDGIGYLQEVSENKAVNMSSDDLSLYAGNSPTGSPRSCTMSPCMDMSLLSPETSPSHFTIISENEIYHQRRSFGELDFSSVDSGYGRTISSDSSASNRSDIIFKFAEPLGVAPKRLDVQITPPKSSTVTCTTVGSMQQPLEQKVSPPKSISCFRPFNSMSSDSMDSTDAYMDLLDMESMDDDSQNLPSHFNSIISGNIKAPPPLRRCLSLNDSNVPFSPVQQKSYSPVQKTPERSSLKVIAENSSSNNITPYSSRATFKRPEGPMISPILSKRYKALNDDENEKENADCSMSPSIMQSPSISMPASGVSPIVQRPVLRKTISMNDAKIMSALARSSTEPDVIGDFSKPFCLPLMDGKHRDLKSISSHTMARLMRGEFNDTVASFKIVDCRYPYEFKGGHISGAENMYTHQEILSTLMSSKTELAKVVPEGPKRNIIVFHCEFSSERGPKLSRFLRNQDRQCNTYPALHYPEIYLLHGGYKEFFETYPELCDPINYQPMSDPSFGSEFRLCRQQTKSWSSGDSSRTGGGQATTNRLMKSRSRLVL